MVRLVSLMVTLLVLAFVIIKLMGGDGSHAGAANTAKVDEARAQQAADQVMQAARAQDKALNNAENRVGAMPDQPGSTQQEQNQGQ